MKSFRNLTLSLLLAAGAAGLAACEGERGPVGKAGPAGTAGAAGPKGAAGDPGRSSDEIPNAYEFLKNWGKADGTAACNDDILNKTEAFPGPAVLPKAATAARRPPLDATAKTVSFKVDLGDPDAAGNADKGECSNKVFPGAIATGSEPAIFTFTPTLATEFIRETKMGTTPVLGNPTFTQISTRHFGGMVAVNLKADAAAAEGTDRLAVRCDGRKRPADAANDGKTITGEYRITYIDEEENILEKDNGINVIKDSHPTTQNDYKLINYTTRLCIRLASVPGTVKCLVKNAFFERDPANDDKQKGLPATVRETNEQIALYKGGQLIQIMPMPYSDGKLAGSSPTASNNDRFPLLGNASAPENFSPGKLCNFFGDAKVPGVIPCSDGEVPGNDGDCTP